jgi:hypothetical protein
MSVQKTPGAIPSKPVSFKVQRNFDLADRNNQQYINNNIVVAPLLRQLSNRILQSLPFALAATASQASLAPSHRV